MSLHLYFPHAFSWFTLYFVTKLMMPLFGQALKWGAAQLRHVVWVFVLVRAFQVQLGNCWSSDPSESWDDLAAFVVSASRLPPGQVDIHNEQTIFDTPWRARWLRKDNRIYNCLNIFTYLILRISSVMKSLQVLKAFPKHGAYLRFHKLYVWKVKISW